MRHFKGSCDLFVPTISRAKQLKVYCLTGGVQLKAKGRPRNAKIVRTSEKSFGPRSDK